MAGEGDDTDDSDDPSTLGDGESQAGGSGALVVRIVVLEGVRRMRLVVVVRMLVVMARLVVVVVVRVLRVLRVMVVTEWFCRFLFVCFLYA